MLHGIGETSTGTRGAGGDDAGLGLRALRFVLWQTTSWLLTQFARTASTSRRPAQPFPDEAALRCRSGTMALKGNLPEKAASSFRQALALNPQLWEAFEGLCALGMFSAACLFPPWFLTKRCIGSIPEIDEIFPPRPPPIKKIAPDEIPGKTVPVATGAGFFTPDAGNGGNLFRTWKPDLSHPQSFRIGLPSAGPRESMYFLLF